MNTSKLIIGMIAFITLSTGVNAQSPIEQLTQMVEQLQKKPTDIALREQIIKLAAEKKPAPAIPEEAKRWMARGAAAFKSAVSAAGYQDAAKEFEQATLAAPWYGDAYYNLGLAQDKAGDFKAALRSLKLALLTSPDSEEIKALIYQVEYRDEKANSPEAQAAREKEAEQRFIASLEGAKYICPEVGDSSETRRPEIEIRNGVITGVQVITWLNPEEEHAMNNHVGFRGWSFDPIPLRSRVNQGRNIRVELFEDRLVYQEQLRSGKIFSLTCLRTNRTR